ncbi:hypothetical protein DCO56_04965 [Sphingobacterium athyrii]|uniref:Uncharacterized protein n=1 Tax=Sphingobacterium athyrii TaxID=2152717 RepID=A0A363NZQ6_9SPHI|nr:hypothetical protein DCO56_04965 [Sphingobacterium athyrii]
MINTHRDLMINQLNDLVCHFTVKIIIKFEVAIFDWICPLYSQPVKLFGFPKQLTQLKKFFFNSALRSVRNHKYLS